MLPNGLWKQHCGSGSASVETFYLEIFHKAQEGEVEDRVKVRSKSVPGQRPKGQKGYSGWSVDQNGRQGQGKKRN